MPAELWPVGLSAKALAVTKVIAIGECMAELSPQETGDLQLGFAGDTFNTAWYLRRLAPRILEIEFLSAIGDDALSVQMESFIRNSGVSTEQIATIPEKTVGLYMISLRDGERSFSYWRSDSAARHYAASLSKISNAGKGTLLYLSGISIAILPSEDRQKLRNVLSQCRLNGALVVLDPNIRPRLWESADVMRREIAEVAALADLVLPSFDDEAAAFGDASPLETASRYLATGCLSVVVKNGAREVCVARPGHEAIQIEIEAIKHPIDTTAAGDSFNAGLLAALIRGESICKCIDRATQIARSVVMAHGALIDLGLCEDDDVR